MRACPWKGPWSGYPLYALLKSLVPAPIPHASATSRKYSEILHQGGKTEAVQKQQ
ncbi:MAG: hypothetical protein J5I59_11760 [Saprospiraceae bacterium]|nr:hypothetical protein [Saprospiraceae bacterium]